MNIFTIIKQGRKSLYTNNSGYTEKNRLWQRLIFIDIAPLCLVIFPLSNNLITDNKDLLNYGLTVISIFAGLMFSLIVVIADKAKARKISIETTANTTDEESINAVNRYLNFASKTISQIAYTIIISLTLIGITLTSQLKVSHNILFTIPQNAMYILKICANTALLYLGVQFFVMIVAIISKMYSFLILETTFNE
jgi:hypothetical protein